MSSPDLSATVPPNTRVRITYSLEWQVISIGEPSDLVSAINAAWQDYQGRAVLYTLATEPAPGETIALGLYKTGGCVVAVRTDAAIPTMTWDEWLAPMRSISASLYNLFDSAKLVSVEFVAAAGTAAGSSSAQTAAATSAAATAAKVASQQEQQSNPFNQLAGYLSTLTGKIVALAVVAALIAAGIAYGPATVRTLFRKKG